MTVKYKNKTYSSDDLPIFLFFKKEKNKREFIDNLSVFNNYSNFTKFQCIDVILAGNTVIKDKRSCVYLTFESVEEKQSLQRSLFANLPDSNAIISSPLDIDKVALEKWIESHIEHLT